MSTQAIAVDRKLTKYFRAPHQGVHDSLNIAMTVLIPSDASRIYQALTRPEYLEAWIALPGDDGAGYLAASQQGDSYRFDHYRDGRRDVAISGAYRLCRRRKMLFTWTVSGDRATTETLVYIGLHGRFGSTLLELHHRGISCLQDRAWQEEMWNRSFERLSQLLRG
jgi:uncharacterized protein YndB with AHSA1/START domain